MTKDEYFAFHREFCDRMVDITQRKNADYTGDSSDPFANFSAVEVDGITTTSTGFLVRMRDKWSRIIALAGGREPAVADESLADSLHDLANYCALFAGYLESERRVRTELCQDLVFPNGTTISFTTENDEPEYVGYIPELEREYQIVAVSALQSTKEFVIESCPDLTLAQHRLEQQREQWPTFKLMIREVPYEHSDPA